jgi:biotin carboxylase
MDDGSTDRRRLLVLGAGPGQLDLLEVARRVGLFIIAVDRDPAAPGFRFADRRAIISVEDEPGIERLAEAERIDAIIAPGIDWSVGIAARVAARLNLPHPVEPEAALLTTSKLRQRERLAEAGIPQPEYELCGTPAETADAADRIGYPCVLKPTDRQGQHGLGVVEAPGGLDRAIEEAFTASRSRAVLVEELVDGPEVTVNGFLVAGHFHPLTVTDRVLADPPAFGVALAHVWRSLLEPAQVGAAVETAAAAAAALGVSNGVTYTKIRIAGKGPRVGEVAARLGSGHDADLCRVALGVNLNELALASAFGDEIPQQALVPSQRVGGACVRFLVTPPGELEAVEGVQQAQAVDGVDRVWIYRRRGHRFGTLRRNSDRAGAILAVGDTAEEAVERASRAAECIRFDTVVAALAEA